MKNATSVEMWIDGFDEPFILKRPNLPQMAILRETCYANGNLEESRWLCGCIALLVSTPSKQQYTLAEAAAFCDQHFEVAIKLVARISEMLP
jgi:hypothetical protein